jgi:hypothetical protein
MGELAKVAVDRSNAERARWTSGGTLMEELRAEGIGGAGPVEQGAGT